MTFRHPLRNEWDRVKPAFEVMAADADRDGVIARAMIDLVPVMIGILERERDRASDPRDVVSAAAAMAGCIAENAIESAYSGAVARRDALTMLLMRIDDVVRVRLGAPGKPSGLILPGHVA